MKNKVFISAKLAPKLANDRKALKKITDITRLIPTVMFLSDEKINNLDALLNIKDKELFKSTTNTDMAMFKNLISSEIINVKLLSDAITDTYNEMK